MKIMCFFFLLIQSWRAFFGSSLPTKIASENLIIYFLLQQRKIISPRIWMKQNDWSKWSLRRWNVRKNSMFLSVDQLTFAFSAYVSRFFLPSLVDEAKKKIFLVWHKLYESFDVFSFRFFASFFRKSRKINTKWK